MELIIAPGVGIGPVRLGMARPQVHDALAPLPGALAGHRSSDSLDFFFDGALQVEYQPDGTACFIGAASSSSYTLSLLGRDPFDTPAAELFEDLAQLDGGEHVFDPRLYVFPRLIVALRDADDRSDVPGGASRPVYRQVGVGSMTYLEATGPPREPSAIEPRPPLWQAARKPGMSRAETVIVAALIMLVVALAALMLLDSPMLAGPSTAMPVTILSIDNDAPSDGQMPSRFMHEVRLPDGSRARFSSPRTHAPGTRLMAMVARSRITGRPVVSPPYVVLPPEGR